MSFIDSSKTKCIVTYCFTNLFPTALSFKICIVEKRYIFLRKKERKTLVHPKFVNHSRHTALKHRRFNVDSIFVHRFNVDATSMCSLFSVVVWSTRCQVSSTDKDLHCDVYTNMTCNDVHYTPYCHKLKGQREGVCTCEKCKLFFL